MRKIEKAFSFNAPWGKLAGLTWGSPNDPPVFLCHGKLDVCSGFRPLAQILPANFFYVAIDLPGNGKSDHFPKGVQFTPMDLLPTVVEVKDHFGWDKFVYIGHSLGVLIGKFFNIAYPGHITKMVELDPIPAHEAWSVDSMREWYHTYYADYYTSDKYKKFTGGPESAPKYTYDQALGMIMKTRTLPKDKAEHVVERCLEPAGDGQYRLTFDQRLKNLSVFPFSSAYLRQIYTATTTPTLCILAHTSMNLGVYNNVPFVKNADAWPNNNYTVRSVEGGHDVHISNPERLVPYISEFLLSNKSKL